MDDFAIVVYSCDKDEDLWPISKKCFDKYWPNHPKMYLFNETKKSDLFDTITFNYELDKWTTRIKKSLNEVKEKYILFVCDDVFLNSTVDESKVEEALDVLKNDIYASINLEIYHGNFCVNTKYDGYVAKNENAAYKFSFLCGLWKREALIDLLEDDLDPWDFEYEQNCKGQKFLQLRDNKVLSWFNDQYGGNGAVRKGLWHHGVEDFFSQEGITIDFSKRGFREETK